MEKTKEKPPEFFKSIKTSLKSVLKHPELNTKIINDAVVKSNKIVIHTLQFLKLYLLDYYENNPNFISPKSRKNEVISFVKNGLKDLSISRKAFSWGIKVPNNSDHVIYINF